MQLKGRNWINHSYYPEMDSPSKASSCKGSGCVLPAVYLVPGFNQRTHLDWSLQSLKTFINIYVSKSSAFVRKPEHIYAIIPGLLSCILFLITMADLGLLKLKNYGYKRQGSSPPLKICKQGNSFP